MDCFGFLVGGIIGFTVGIVVGGSSYNSEIALKLANTMNSSMLDCVAKQVITKDQVHDIETIFHKHIEENFKGIKASHSSEDEEKKEK